jgi:hypothetical protein
MTPPAKFAAVTADECSGTSVAANIRTTFRERPMGLISKAWTNLAPPGAKYATSRDYDDNRSGFGRSAYEMRR